MPETSKAWLCTLGQWTEIPDPLREVLGDVAGDDPDWEDRWKAAVKQLGYLLYNNLGTRDEYEVRVYQRFLYQEGAPASVDGHPTFLVDINLGDWAPYVYAANLPSFLYLLNLLMPTISGAVVMDWIWQQPLHPFCSLKRKPRTFCTLVDGHSGACLLR